MNSPVLILQLVWCYQEQVVSENLAEQGYYILKEPLDLLQEAHNDTLLFASLLEALKRRLHGL